MPSSDGFADIVVVGFGEAGAAAALAAATRGASVVALDRGDPAPSGFRAAAVRAGVDFRAQCRVHELTVIGGRVAGIGFASLRAGTLAATGHRMFDKLRRRAPAPLAMLASRAADTVWDSRFDVGQINCAAVILALDSCHWEFVASALEVASPTGAALGSAVSMPAPAMASTSRRRLALVGSERSPVSDMGFRVDEVTRMVTSVEDASVAGLYAAVPADSGAAHLEVSDGRRAADSARRSALCADYGRLRSVL